MPISIASKRIEFLRINLTKEVKNLYIENCKVLMKKKTRINGKIVPDYGLG